MTEPVFDAFRASRILSGQLADDDAVRQVARDPISSRCWVLTDRDLVVLDGDAIGVRAPLEQLRGEVRDSPAGVDVRVQPGAGAAPVLASFPRPNKLTDRLSEILRANLPREA